MKLQSENIYLSTLEREHCRKLWAEFEYDFENPAEELNMGHSVEKADGWFDEIQSLQGGVNVRLGIFLNSGEVIGDVALQNIDRTNRKCDIGMGINKLEHRCKGYGKEAVKLMLDYAFNQLGMERVEANTLSLNIAAQKSLEKLGFMLEGVQRKAVYIFGKKADRMMYAILKEEYNV
ncbi:GNAT family protein [Ruminococcus sp. Marseille-P6503]|uniref:GNAT family N-acetyltransferase n=1 Tax=Ruminococcus sp. Marseille-P6503 TaxID=2364796 RepID=UPI000F54478B|nr:GNAT family protein [Ruminococcus sp. Marseille-P6503]